MPTMLPTAILLRRSLARLSRRLRTQSREAGLSAAKLSILGHLHRDGAMTPGALAAAEGVQPQSLTRVLADLEEAVYVLRQQDEKDRRQFRLEITPKGREVLVGDAKRRAVWLASAMEARLTDTERELLRLAAELMDRLAGFNDGEDSEDSDEEQSEMQRVRRRV
jgi:DNA-binding MarR family transcriptional regulator